MAETLGTFFVKQMTCKDKSIVRVFHYLLCKSCCFSLLSVLHVLGKSQLLVKMKDMFGMNKYVEHVTVNEDASFSDAAFIFTRRTRLFIRNIENLCFFVLRPYPPLSKLIRWWFFFFFTSAPSGRFVSNAFSSHLSTSLWTERHAQKKKKGCKPSVDSYLCFYVAVTAAVSGDECPSELLCCRTQSCSSWMSRQSAWTLCSGPSM